MGEGREEGAAAPPAGQMAAGPAASWRLNVSDFQQMPERPKEPPFVTRVLLRSHGVSERRSKVNPECTANRN
ncbi:metal tolerance protein 7 isoform X1 [Panicum miliaceum]|uniref:Metal tolerance protein 7 isoform X1 n=1 Tax=Panicum miliaceum TaxID=4540 RepID=A0A3L6QX23_PANMI|nr:metal tolerance protein 7 isoform X1 [Panicum miliaceum]